MKKSLKNKKFVMNKEEMNLVNGGALEAAINSIVLLNSNSLTTDKEKLGCFLNYKVYQCTNYEATCPVKFTYNDCNGLNTSCSSNFTLKPME